MSNWLVTGSENGAYEDLTWIACLKTCLRQLVDSGRPIVGICFGHQILADILGGRVEKFDGGWVIGRTAYETTNGTQLNAMAWHQDQVLDLPDEARRLASSKTCKNAMMLVGGNVLGIQPHPEFDRGIVEAALAAYTFLPSDLWDQAQATAAEPIARDALAEMIEVFLRSDTRDPDTLQGQLMATYSKANLSDERAA